MHPLHVQHGSEQANVVVHAAERLHALKQLRTRQTQTFESRTASFLCERSSDSTTTRYLDGVVKGGAGRVQREVLEGFDLRRLPAGLLRPADGQHVVGEVLAEQQRGRVGLGLACCVPLDGEIRCLRRRRTSRAESGNVDESRAGRGYSDCSPILVIRKACFI